MFRRQTAFVYNRDSNKMFSVFVLMCIAWEERSELLPSLLVSAIIVAMGILRLNLDVDFFPFVLFLIYESFAVWCKIKAKCAVDN